MKIALFHTDGDIWGFGIRIISSILRKERHKTKLFLITSHVESLPTEVLEQAKDLVSDCDLVGLSCHAYGAQRARQLAMAFRPLGKPVIWGGIHATLCPERCAEYADLVCMGEGEETILELIDRLKTGRDWRDVANLAFKKNGHLKLTPLRPLISDLDTLPLFDFERENEYHLRKNSLVRVDVQFERSRAQEVFYIGSRGCAFNCTYCCNTKLRELYKGKGRHLRRKSVSNYIADLEILSNEHFPKATGFWLADEDFFLRNVDEMSEFSELYRSRIGIPFECESTPPMITKDKLDLLAGAGLWRLNIGIESGSERTKREIYNRPISNSVVLQVGKTVHEYPQIVPRYDIIMANPYESNSDLIDTLKLMAKLPPPFMARMFNLMLFPGSALYQRAVTDRIISGEEDSTCDKLFVGLKYQDQQWKQKNLYLNSLLFLASGKATRWSLGLLPRFMFPILLHPKVVKFCDSRKWTSKWLIKFKSRMGSIKIRTRTRRLLKKILRKAIAKKKIGSMTKSGAEKV